jgi:hypothetical protein
MSMQCLARTVLVAALGSLTAVSPDAFAQNRVPDRAPESATKSTGGAEGDRRACEEQKKRFMESQACFAKFRLANGGLRPEAFQHCTEVKQPRGC